MRSKASTTLMRISTGMRSDIRNRMRISAYTRTARRHFASGLFLFALMFTLTLDAVLLGVLG